MARFIFGGSNTHQTENISSQIDCFRQTFDTSTNFDSDSLKVYYNGIRQITNVTVTIVDDNSFTLSFIPPAGTYILVDYISA